MPNKENENDIQVEDYNKMGRFEDETDSSKILFNNYFHQAYLGLTLLEIPRYKKLWHLFIFAVK